MTSAPSPPEPLAAAVLGALTQASTATITTQLFARGLRNSYLHGLVPASAGHQRFAGEAFTLRYIPAREDVDVLAAFEDYDHPQRKAVESVPPGAVLVVDCRNEARAASAGSILMTRLQVRGAAAFVSDGSVRDMQTIGDLTMPVFSRGPAATTNLALHHAVDLQVPVGCAGVAVYPGDVMVGDGDGVVCIPRHLVEEVAIAAARQERMEDFISLKVADGAPLRGLYPPDAVTRAEYEATASTADASHGN